MEEIRKLLNKSTTPEDIYRISNKRCNIYTYPELVKFKNIDDMFKRGKSDVEQLCRLDLPFDNKCCVILYMTGPNYGHWTALSKNKYGINFLDSYGDIIDDQLIHVDKNIKGQDKKMLIKLLLRCKHDIYYNDIKLQELNTNIATCGRYCALYLKYNNMNIDDFVKIIKNKAEEYNMTPDEIVCALSLQ
jgi:hypothetical protein